MKTPTPADLGEFRKLDQAAQLKQLRGTKVERTFTIERDGGLDEEKRTVWLSIASEEPYERWWGVEILEVRKDAIRDERLKSGAPLLVGHDSDRQVGVIEAFEITPAKKLRVLARFSKSAYAEEIWRDVLDGIRRNTSVGYIIHDLVLQKQEEGVSTFLVKDWEPLEGSLVAVPADHTVGVGRSHEPALPPNPILKEKTLEKTKEQLEAEQQQARDKAAADARAAEHKRVGDILAAGAVLKAQGGDAVALECVRDPNATLASFNAKMVEKMSSKGSPSGAAPADLPKYGDGARQLIMRGQKLRAFTQPLRFTDGSQMDPTEAAYRAGRWVLATLAGNESARRWCKDNGLDINTRVMTGDVGSAGGYVVPAEMEQAIIDLREDYGLARRLCRRQPMGSDTLAMPKRTGGVTAYFVNEDNSGITASDMSWGNVQFVAKTLAALTKFSTNLGEDAIVDMADRLALEMSYAFATKEDQCWLIGDGSSTYGGMVGLKTLFEASALASRPDAASGHDTFAEYDNADIVAVMGAVADFPGLNPVWLGSKLFANVVLNRLKASAGGNNVQTLEGRPKDNYLGYDVYTSEIMPKVLTDLSDVVNAFYGDFSKSSSFGDRRGIAVRVSDERYVESLQIGVVASERFHVVNHDVGTTAVKGPVAALYGE